MKSKLIKFLIVGAVTTFVGSSVVVQAQTAALELISGATTIVVQDNGVADTSPTIGDIQWNGSINGWTIVVTTGDSKPLLGSATSPQMDLSVTSATPGAAPLTVELTDTGFGPTASALVNVANQNGTSAETASVLADPSNTQFGGSPVTSVNLAAPYSLTIKDVFTVGTISADDRVSTVPDGGMTVLLLGAALTALGLMKRRLA